MSAVMPGREREVFISVGHSLIPQHATLVRLISAYLLSQSITPVKVERQAQQISDPVGTIRNIVRKSAGTIVIATVRHAATGVVVLPSGANAQSQPGRATTTVWNQIEAAMTLQCQHPLLILCEEGLTYEGIIDPSIHPLILFSTEEITDQLPAHVLEALNAWCTWL